MFLRSSKNVSTEKIKPIETGSGCQACSSPQTSANQARGARDSKALPTSARRALICFESSAKSKLAQSYPCGALLLTGCGGDVKLTSKFHSDVPPC